ncbi:MAG: hypothetical protein V1652_01820 [bacterium]
MGCLHVGNRIFFKNTGEPVTIQATASRVFQYKITDVSEIIDIIDRFGKDICLVESSPKRWRHIPRYCILMELQNVRILRKPFYIDKKGFGIGAAWITVKDVAGLKQ